MINFEIDLGELVEARVKLVESIEIKVGVGDRVKYVAIADHNQKTTLKNNSGNVEVNKVARLDKTKTLQDLSIELESKFNIFSDALTDKENDDLIRLSFVLNEIFAAAEITKIEMNMMRNYSRALIRNRILERRLGSNSTATQDEKGFDRVAMDTGTFFLAIDAMIKHD